MRTSLLRHIPVVDENRRVIGLRTIEEFVTPTQQPNWVVVMAGGQGTRLRPLTGDCPKPMLPLGDRPLLEHTIENLKGMGFERFFIAVNYMADVIISHFKDGSKFGVDIRYLHEETALGTAGALSLLPERPDAPFIVMNGDIVTKLHFPSMLDFHNEHGAAGTIGVREYETQVPYGVIEIDRMTISSIREKPTQRHIISGGVYVLSPQALDAVPRNIRYDMPQLFQDMQKFQMQTIPFFIREYWIDIGRIDDLTRAQTDFRQIFIDE
jgi:NDP-sugar pyrophosphorylase family protein